MAFMSWPFLAVPSMEAHFVHFMPLAAAALQQAMASGVLLAQQVVQVLVAAQFDSRRVAAEARTRVMVFTVGYFLCLGDPAEGWIRASYYPGKENWSRLFCIHAAGRCPMGA